MTSSFFDCVAELLGRQLGRGYAAEEVAVVLGDVGAIHQLVRIAFDDFGECLLVSLDKFELELLDFVELVDEPLASDVARRLLRVIRGDETGLHLPAEGGEQHKGRGHALLAVDEYAAFHRCLGDDGAEEV